MKDQEKVPGSLNSGSAMNVSQDRAGATAQPPLTNRGVFMSLGLDWLNFSKVCGVTDLHGLAHQIALQFRSDSDFRHLSRGYEGVDVAYKGTLSWRGDHLRVELPALAMQYIRYRLGLTDEQICSWFLERGFSVTRCDAAIDCADKVFNPLVAYRYMQNDNVRCEASCWDYRFSKAPKSKAIFPKNGKGMTTYAGSRLSDRMIRFYDKLDELSKKTGEVPTDQYGTPLDHLTRIELQCRRKASHALAREVVTNGVGAIKSVIGGYITFLNPRDKRKKRRRSIAPFWERIVGNERRFLTLPQLASSPDSSILWIKHQVVPTLKMMQDMAPDKWKQLLNEWIADYEINPKRLKDWEVWNGQRQARDVEIKDEIEEERQHKLAKEAKLKDQLELDRQKRLDDAVIAQVRADLAGNQSEAS
jgi:hypothetical protein